MRMITGHDSQSPQTTAMELAELKLLHLADSALPTGAFAHSFGIESLVSEGLLEVSGLHDFLATWLEEVGVGEAVFCRAALRLASDVETCASLGQWLDINDRYGALKPARETREASAALGRNFLRVALAVEELSVARRASQASREARGEIHHCTAFGLVSGALQLPEDRAVPAYLHQSIAGVVSVCQRLMPLGQTSAMQLLWNLKQPIMQAARRSAQIGLDDVYCFVPLQDWGAMEHPALFTRLFIS